MSVASTQRIDDEASRWLILRGMTDWSEQKETEFQDWMNASVQHCAAFWRLEMVWEKAGRLQALQTSAATFEPPSMEELNLSPDFVERTPVVSRRFEGWRALAAAVGLIAVLGLVWLFWPGQDLYRT